MNCDKCGRVLNERIETVWNLVEGWEKKRDQGGTNHLALRKPKEQFRCNGCMTLILDGLNPGQESLTF
jgi:hypothetical protein